MWKIKFSMPICAKVKRKEWSIKMEAAEWIMLAVLTGFAAYDIKTKTISVTAVTIAAASVLLYRLCIGIGIWELVIGLIPGVFLLVLAFATRESIGIGDGLVLGMLGLFCGWRQCLAMLGMALVLSAFLSILLLLCHKVGRKTELPFLPSLLGGYLLYYLW